METTDSRVLSSHRILRRKRPSRSTLLSEIKRDIERVKRLKRELQEIKKEQERAAS